MINFHVGLPGVVADIAEVLERAIDLHRRPDFGILGAEFLAIKIQPYLNSRAKDPTILAALRESALASTSAMQRNMHFACSQPQLLGSVSDLLRPGKTLALAEVRFRRLIEVLDGFELCVHLTITNQVDTIWQLADVSHERRLRLLLESQLSWSNLVWRLRRAVPNCNIVVWDLERCNEMTPYFVEAMLQVENETLDPLLYQMVSCSNNGPPLEVLHYCSVTEALAVEALDDLYDVELEKIAKMKGVTLMRLSS